MLPSRFLGRLVLFFVFAGGLGWADGMDQAPTITIAPAPAWVKPIDPDSVAQTNTSDLDEGVDYVLIDRQQLVEPRSAFLHYTRRIVTDHGLEDNADISDDFDPSYETFTMHWLKIKRDGVWQDRLATETYQLLHREKNLDSQLLDGRYSVVYHLKDIRVGDEIDYAYTIAGSNPVFGGKYIGAFSTSWSSPVGLFSCQLTIPSNRTINYRSFGPAIEPVRTKISDQADLVVWRKEKLPATVQDQDTPNWYDTYGWVQLSEYASWKEVVDWGLSVYPFDDPPSAALQSKISEISTKYTSPEDRALAAIRFVQDDIRYLGIEMGANSCKPTAPSLVCEHRFGDCKDKSMLCVTMLRALGIEAYPVLVDTDYRQNTGLQLPSAAAFDHAIVKLIVDNRTYWIDVTRNAQEGRLRDLYVGDFKQVLVLKKDNTDLEPMTVSPESMPNETVEDTFTVKSVQEPVLLQIHTICKGLSAETRRGTFGESSLDKIEKSYLDYYSHFYPKLTATKPLRFQDFPDDNRFEVWEEYSVPKYWTRDNDTSPWKGIFSPHIISDVIGSAPTPQRTAPYRLSYPMNVTENMEVRMFEKWSVSSGPNEVKTSYLTFSDEPSVKDNVVFFKFHFQTLVPDIPASDILDYHDQIKKLQDSLDYRLTYTPKTDAPPASPPPPTFRPNWMAIALALLTFIFSCYVAVHIFVSKRPRPPLPRPTGLAEYDGVGGWLILMLIGLGLGSFACIKGLVIDHQVTWNAVKWDSVTAPGGANYDPLWAPALLLEMAFTIFLFVGMILLFVLILQKRAIVPRLMVGFLAMIAVYKCLDMALVSQIPYMVKLNSTVFDTDFFRVVVQSCIWIPYFLVSRRSKATFRF